MYIKLSVMFILLGMNFIFAQLQIHGKITDQYENGLPDVHIQLNQKEHFTDINGDYLISGLPVGEYRVQIEFPGFEQFDSTIYLSRSVEFNVRLKPEISFLQEARIQHSVSGNEKTIPVHTLNEKVLDKFNGKSLGDVLQEIEGVSALKTGNSIVKPVVNGLHSSRVAVISNNLKLEDQEWGSEHAPNIDINSANSIQVIKGANALQYSGDAVGGIILVNAGEPFKKDTVYGKSLLAFNSNGRGGTASTSFNRDFLTGWFWNATLTGKYSGDLQSPEYNLSNTSNREQNVFFQGGFKNHKNGIWATYSLFNSQSGILKASHIGSLKDLVNAINNQEPYYISGFSYNLDHPKQEVQHHVLKLNAFQRFPGIGKLDFQYGFQYNNRKEFDIRRGEYAKTPVLDLDLKTHSANLDFESEKFNLWKFKTGISTVFQVNEPNPLTNVRPLIPDYERFDFGAYTVSEFNPNPRWHLNLGIRYDFSRLDAKKYYLKSRWEERNYDEQFPDFVMAEYGSQILVNPVYDFHNFSSSFGINFHPRHDFDFYFNASYITRNPNPAELFSDGLHHSIATIELGDLSLKQENAWKFSLTAQQRKDNFSWDVSPYLNRINDFIQLVPEGLEYTIRGAFPVWSYQQTNALIAGIDAAANWNYSPDFSHKITAAYLYGQDLENENPLIDMPPFNFSNSLTYKNEKWNAFEISIKNQTYLTQNRFPDNNFTADLNIDGETVPTYVDISTPPKGYTLFGLDASVDMGSVLGWKKSMFNLGFSVENIFNVSYQNYLNHQRFYADEIGRNFIIQLKINY